MNKEARPIGYIENGTVIDHIPSSATLEVARILKVDPARDSRASLGWGLRSERMGVKGVIKIEDRELTPAEYNLVALVAPHATISIIKEGGVNPEGKRKAEIPTRLEGVVYCANANCITNAESEQVGSLINYDPKSERFSCHYCEHSFTREQARLNLNGK